MRAGEGRQRLLPRALMLCLLVTAGCTYRAEIPVGLDEPPTGAAGEAGCGLFTTEEIEVVANGPLTGTINEAATPVLPGMDMCARSSKGFVVSWGIRREHGKEAFGRYREWHAEYVEKIDIDGVDETDAIWDERLGTLVARAKDQVFGIRLEARGSARAGKSAGASLRDQAEELTSRALKRL